MSFEREYQKNYVDSLRKFHAEMRENRIAMGLQEFLEISDDVRAMIKGQQFPPSYVRWMHEEAGRIRNLVDYIDTLESWCSSCHGSGMSFAGGSCQSCRPGYCWHCDKKDCDRISCLD